MKQFLQYLLLLVFVFPLASKAQEHQGYKDSVIQFYGVVLTADSLQALPSVSVSVKGRNQGTITSSYFNYCSYVQMTPLHSDFRWMPGLHGDEGNLLFSDGQVEQVDTPKLRAAAERGADFYAGAHNWRFLLPR